VGTDKRERSSPAAAATIGLLSAALLLALSVGSSIADRYMPRNDNSVGLLAYVAQMVRQPDGRCPVHSAPNGCAPDPAELLDRTGR
jgi:galactan 5-O-arabinofuranosyltransferase